MESDISNFQKLGELMIKYGAVIRAIPKTSCEVYEKYHLNDFPSECCAIKYLDEYKREMLVVEKEMPFAGKFLLTFAKHSHSSVRFSSNMVFNSIEEIATYLMQMEEN